MAQTNGGVVDLASWANKSTTVDGKTTTTSRVTGYTFDHAAIGSRDGTTITGVKVEKNENDTQRVQTDTNTYSNVKVTTYKLYYTTDSTVSSSSRWTQYKDSASGTSDNSANIYLIYRKDGTSKTQEDPSAITVHHVDSEGYQVADNTSATYWFDSASTTYNNMWNGGTGIIANNNNSAFAGLHTASGLSYSNTAYIGASWTEKASPVNGSLFYKKDSSGVWHTGTGTRNGGNSTSNTVTNEIKGGNSDPVLYTNLYYVYSNVKGVTVHFVDENGKEIAGGGYALTGTAIFTASEKAESSSSLTTGYTYKEARVGGANGSIFTTIDYTKADDGTWSSTVKNGESTVETSSVTKEVWLVYTKDTTTKTFTVNYKYINTSGITSDAYYVNNAEDTDTSKTTDTFSVTSGKTKQLVRDETSSTGYADIIHDGNVKRAAAGEETEAQNLSYMATHLGSVDGPEISSVDVDSDGNITYRNSYTATLSPSLANPNRYTASAASGRSFVIVKDDDGNLTLQDSRNGSFDLNYANDKSSAGEASYTATYHGENETTEYKAIKSTTSDAYEVSVEAYIPSTNTQIYQTYIDSDSNGRKIWIDNDLMYSGLFRVGTSDTVSTELAYKTDDESTNRVTNLSYEWTRIVTSGGTTTETVLNDQNRKQTGDHWNVAGDAEHRTWVDIEADEGSDIWRAGTTVSYKVKLTYTYTDGSGPHTYTLESEPVSVGYYGQLENGSFETPVILNSSGAQINDFTGNQTSNADYKKNGGVWQTTGIGDNSVKAGSLGHDIEIFNVKQGNTGLANYWRNSADSTSNKETPVAADGDQFAELNCETAGALYQDVITHPNESLSYGLSHRARIQNTASTSMETKYDSMYLVIIPTSLAMTSGANQTELKTQADLQKFIENHGGYDTSNATSEEDRITYYDTENGILIRKISSDNFDWHTIAVANGYVAKGGLTRFFFVAGQTSSGDKTEGNFLDNVYFSQNLPEPKGFNLTVTKTFRGLTQAQLAAMATNNNADNPFTFDITNVYTQSNTTYHNDSLQNAKLQFTATPSGTSSFTFTATARQWEHKKGDNEWEVITEDEYNSHSSELDFNDKYRVVDLFDSSDGNTGTVKTNTDGSVTMTWTFTDQSLPSSALDRTFNYTVAESNYSVSGLIPTHTYSLNGGATQSGTSGMIALHQGDTVSYAFTNSYAENTGNPSQITVTKTFSGVTRTTVEKLLNGYSETVNGTQYEQDPYSITVTKTTDDKGEDLSVKPTIDLTPTNTGTVTVGTGQTANVTYNLSEDASNGKVTLTWVIQEIRPDGTAAGADDIWMGGSGTYTVSEKNYTPTPHANSDQNELKTVEINGKSVTISTKSAGAIDLGTIHAGKVSDTDYSPTMSGSGTVTSTPTTLTVSSDIDLIIGQTSDGNYVVWTKDTAGANLRQSVISFINSTEGLGSGTGAVTATLDNTSFRSGTNPGALKYNTANSGTTMTFNGGTEVTFANDSAEGSVTWTKGYATIYALTDKEDGDMKNNATEARIANSYEPIVRIKKVDGDDTTTALGGATFHLFKYEGSTKKYLLKDGTWAESGTDANPIKDFTTSSTDGDDKGVISFGKLAIGTRGTTYYAEESKAPDGYNKLTKPIAVTVNENGVVTLEGNNSDNARVDNSVATISWDSPYYTITVSNKAGVVLPITGGRGTWMFTIFGLLLMAVAGGLLVLRKRRR